MGTKGALVGRAVLEGGAVLEDGAVLEETTTGQVRPARRAVVESPDVDTK